MLTHGIRPAFRDNGVHLYRQQPSCILEGQSRVYRVTTQLHHRGSVPSLSSHRPIAYRWSSPPRVRRRRVSNPRRSSSNGMLPFHVSKMGHFLCVSFFRRSWTRVTVYRKYQIYVTVSIALSATEELLVCVCVCVFSSHSFWTSRSLDVTVGVTQDERSHRISRPPSFCGARLYFSREKDSAIPFPRRP